MRRYDDGRIIWAASVWWRGCDPLCSVLGYDKQRVEQEAQRIIEEEARCAVQEQAAENMDSALGSLCWTGVINIVDVEHAFMLDDMQMRELEDEELVVICPSQPWRS